VAVHGGGDMTALLGSAGRPLDGDIRTDMEAGFGTDLAAVRVHAGSKAASSARALGALAYTAGRHIVLGDPAMASGAPASRQVLAHELTHVLQYRKGGITDPVASGLEARSASPTDAFEREADTMGSRARRGRPLGPVAALSAMTGPMATGAPLMVARLAPDQARTDADEEAQRQEAMRIVKDQCPRIQRRAQSYGIAPEAIGGAILWEALENPYSRSFSRLGPGKVHPFEYFAKSEAEKVEDAGMVPKSKDSDERQAKLKDPGTAVDYIAAIMARHATNYQTIAGVDIKSDVGVLCTLYQGGHSEERAKKLAERRKTDPNARPQAADRMGPWVVSNLDWVRRTMACTSAPPPGPANKQG
jgi:hypothetical protein